MSADTRMLFPIGHLVGVPKPQPGAAPVIRIRVGWQLIELTNPLEFELWRIAHGVPEHDWSKPWTRDAVIDHYLDPKRKRETACNIDLSALVSDIAFIEESFDKLIKLQVVVGLDPLKNQRQAELFVRKYRLHPLLTGLGDTPEAPGMERFGTRELSLALLPASFASLWRGLLCFQSLQAIADDISIEVTKAGRTSTPEGIIRQLLADLRPFLVFGAGYLDRAVEPAAGAADPAMSTTVSDPRPQRTPAPQEEQVTKHKPMNEQEYREYASGMPGGIRYATQDPQTGASYEFDGIADGVLLYTISHTKWRHYAGLARTQIAAARGCTIEWRVQHEKAATAIRAKLSKAGITQVRVVHLP